MNLGIPPVQGQASSALGNGEDPIAGRQGDGVGDAARGGVVCLTSDEEVPRLVRRQGRDGDARVVGVCRG